MVISFEDFKLYILGTIGSFLEQEQAKRKKQTLINFIYCEIVPGVP